MVEEAPPVINAAPVHGLANLPFAAEPIRTERLSLRPHRESDLDDVHDYQRREEVVRYLQWEVRDREQTTEMLMRRIAMTRLARDGDGIFYAVELPDPSGAHRVVGDVSVQAASVSGAQIELGWVFHPAVHGHGFATEAGNAVLDLCFGTLGAHRVYAELDPRNDASARLCERLGMRAEAHFRQNLIVKDDWADTVAYAMLANEWRGAGGS